MELLYRLSDQLSTYYNATNVSLKLLNPEGETMEKFGPDYPYCRIFQESSGQYCPCHKSHLHACQEAARLGEGYIFACPAGYIHFAVPVSKNNQLIAHVLAGPIALEYPDLDLIDEIIQKHNLSLNYRTKLYSTYSSAPLVEPYRARYLCKLLFSLVANLMSVDAVLLEKQSAKSLQQSKIGEYMQLVKEIPSLPSSQYDLEKQLIEDVLQGNREHASSILNEMLGRIYFTSGNNIEIIKTRSIELIALLSRAVVENGGSKEDVYQMTDTFLHNISNVKDLTDLSFSLLEILNLFISMAFSFKKTPAIPALQKALKYINENYCSNLSLEEVANHVGLNQAYFSSLFKKEMQINFSNYLMEKRITQAKHLLKNSNASLLEIALASGFENQSYFSNVFKKQTGMTPKQYRYSL